MEKECSLSFPQIYEKCLGIVEKQLSEEERELFLTAGRHLMSDDLEYHKDREEQFLAEIRERIAQEKIQFRQNQKIVYACCLAASGMLIVILL